MGRSRALAAKELLFRYMLPLPSVCAPACCRQRLARTLGRRLVVVVALGIVGNVFGYRLLDPVAALSSA
ncbi:hypothetical protein [Arthrobacter methylotrophus]|uniref:hypothetical protein n=1 Tax=Arthrobacter methylotrophus TaxID=121291 RepID=UPI0031E7917E